MKNLFLGLIATAMFSFSANASNNVRITNVNNSNVIEKNKSTNVVTTKTADWWNCVPFKSVRTVLADGSIVTEVFFKCKWILQ